MIVGVAVAVAVVVVVIVVIVCFDADELSFIYRTCVLELTWVSAAWPQFTDPLFSPLEK